MSFSSWFAKFKSSPETWAVAGPALAVLAGAFGRHFEVALAAMIASAFVPVNRAPAAQRIHFLIGYLATSIAGLYGLLFLPIAAYLEFVFDPKNEHDPILWGGIWDFSSYTVGLVAGLL